MTLYRITTLIFSIIILLILRMLKLHLVHTSVRMATGARGTILLLSILLELMWHVSMCTVANSTSCLSQVPILVVGTLREVL